MAKRKIAEELQEIEDLLEEVIEEVEAEEASNDLLSAKQAALMIGTDARTLRKFLRSEKGLVGQGNRWAIDEDDVADLKERFKTWHAPKVKEVVIKTTEVDEDDDLLDDLDDLDELIDD